MDHPLPLLPSLLPRPRGRAVRVLRILVPALLLGAPLPAQDAQARPAPLSTYDVHFLSITQPPPGELPELRADGVRRYQFPANARGGSGEIEAEITGSVGTAPLVQSFALIRGAPAIVAPDISLPGGLQVVEVPRKRTAGGEDPPPSPITVRCELRWHGARMSSTAPVSARGFLLSTTMWFGHGGGGGRRPWRCALGLPQGDPSATLGSWSPEEYAAAVSGLTAGASSATEIDSVVLEALSRLPLEKMLDPRQREQLLRSLGAPEESEGLLSRMLAGGRRIVSELRPHGQAGGAMGPVVVRRGISRGGRRGVSDVAVTAYVRLLAGDYGVLESLSDPSAEEYDWELGRVLAVSYAQVEDPERKGQVGWRAIEPRYGAQGLVPLLVAPLAAAVREGRAILPGTAEERTARERRLLELEAETRVSEALVLLGGAGAALVVIVLLARQFARWTVF